MSTALAVAGVSAVLRDLLNDGLVNHNVSGIVGSSVTVTTLPPDKVVQVNGTEITQLNLFLRHITPNSGWRNEGLAARDGSGRQRLSNPPLALNLHYLISAYGASDLHAEILLGYAMQLLHERPFITRDAIRRALQPSPDVGIALPPALRALADSGLEDQVEQLRITPQYLSTEEMSKFWTATLAHFRPSAAYEVAVVLIQAKDPAPRPLPVLKRGISAHPDLLPPMPHIASVVPANAQPVVQLGTLVTLKGDRLAGTGREVRLVNDRFEVDETLPAEPGDSSTQAKFSIPVARAADFPVGTYRVGVHVQPAGESEPRATNQLALMLAPSIAGLPMSVTRDGVGTASFAVSFTPELRAGQTARLVLGQEEYAPEPFTPPTATLNFVIPNAPVANHLARLRIDEVDNPIIDPLATPPAFLGQRIDIQ